MADEIEAIELKRTQKRQDNWDKLQEYYDELKAALEDLTQDPFQFARRLRILNSHAFAQMEKDCVRACTYFLHDHQIKALKELHTPSIAQIAMCCLKIGGSAVAGIIGVVPAFTGVIGASAASYQAASNAVQQAVGGGADTVGSFLQTGQQGALAVANAEIDLNKQRMQYSQGLVQGHEREYQTGLDHGNQDEQIRSKTVGAVLNG